MGASLSSIYYGLFCSKTPMQVLMIGLDGAGKTTILYKLKLGEIMTTIPTPGMNVETVEYKNISFTMWDIGCKSRTVEVWWKYYFTNVHMDGLIFVVDSNDRERIEEAEEGLHNMLDNEDLKDSVLLVLANKQDLPNAISIAELTDKLKLNNLRNGRWYIQAASGTQGNGLYEGLDWLSNELAK